jgi:GNAT superfamily N-acetyltransferase
MSRQRDIDLPSTVTDYRTAVSEECNIPNETTKTQRDAEAQRPTLTFRPLAAELMDALEAIFRGNWGTGCWCMYPRLTAAQMRNLPGPGSFNRRRRDAMTELARRPIAPGLLAFEDGEPVGWIAIAPRRELSRAAASRATPAVDDHDVWVIPCITVRKTARGRGIAVALIRAAVAYAGENGAPLVEAYPRAGAERTGDDNVYFGTELLFRRAGFRVVRQPLENRPRNWLPRLAMRSAARAPSAPPQRRSG